MRIQGFYNDPEKAEELLLIEIYEAEAKEDKKRVIELKILKEAMDTGREFVLREALYYLALFGYPAKTRTSFYKLTELTHSIPYHDRTPEGEYGGRMYERETLDLFIKYPFSFLNTKDENEYLKELKKQNRSEFRIESIKLGKEKLEVLRERLSGTKS
jgi:hypothetical protein